LHVLAIGYRGTSSYNECTSIVGPASTLTIPAVTPTNGLNSVGSCGGLYLPYNFPLSVSSHQASNSKLFSYHQKPQPPACIPHLTMAKVDLRIVDPIQPNPMSYRKATQHPLWPRNPNATIRQLRVLSYCLALLADPSPL
jgi:hypothetical protein